MAKTSAWSDKRVVLRGRSTEVIDQVADEKLDFAYIDGDHTLRGITVDLTKVFPRVRAGGWIGGDDFSPSIWQHPEDFEPTLVCPFVVYFAEAVGTRIYALPRLIEDQVPGSSSSTSAAATATSASAASSSHMLLRAAPAPECSPAGSAIG